jgi:hypothetical protein
MAQPDIEVKIDEGALRSAQKMLANIPRGLNKVVSRAINKVGVWGRKRIVDKVAADIPVKKSTLKKLNIKLKRASYFKWRAEINITGKRIPLIELKARGLKRGGVAYNVRKTGGRRVHKHAFIATMKSGHRGVFARAGSDAGRVPRLPIIKQRGPSVPQVFHNIAEFSSAFLETALARKLGKEIEQQVGVLIEQEANK